MLNENATFEGKGITLLNFKEGSKGATLYQFDLRIESWHTTFKNCSIVEGSNDKKFFSFARRKYTTKDGQEKWTSDIWMDDAEKDRLTITILELINEKFKN